MANGTVMSILSVLFIALRGWGSMRFLCAIQRSQRAGHFVVVHDRKLHSILSAGRRTSEARHLALA